MSPAKTSITAYGVVCGLHALAAMPQWRGYFSGEMLSLNNAFLNHGRDRPVKQIFSRLPPRAYIAAMDRFFVPGMVHHFLFRKRLIENYLMRAVGEGASQVIVLGGGLDTLAVRMARHYPSVRFFELDLAPTQQAKLRILERIGHPVLPNCRFVPADLGQATLAGILQAQPGFDAAAATLVILEGVLMYLREADVKTLFTAMHELFAGPLTVLFGATAASDTEGSWHLRLFNALLGRGQEGTHWHCPGRAMPPFMRDSGYEVREWMPYKKLQSFYRKPEEIRDVPEEDENYYVVTKMTPPPASGPAPAIGKLTLMLI